jgi:oligopeptide/dipeptide ABC transporter ATP-binding protein
VLAVDYVSLSIRRGRITAIVGESGSGKSSLARAILRLPSGIITHGSVEFEGRDLVRLSERELRQVRGRRISMIFQNPLTSLNPLLSVRRQMADTYRAHKPHARAAEVESRVKEVLGKLGIDESRLSAYPHELSGGMTQRVMIGMGLICGADFVLADEPTTSLDVLVEASFLRTLHDLCRNEGVGVVLVSHDMGLVEMWADDIAVMYAGRIVEFGPADVVFNAPQHPYTRQLVGATPALDRELDELVRLGGSPPNLDALPTGCAFHPRCPLAQPICAETKPPVIDLPSAPGQRHQAACLLLEAAPTEELTEARP